MLKERRKTECFVTEFKVRPNVCHVVSTYQQRYGAVDVKRPWTEKRHTAIAQYVSSSQISKWWSSKRSNTNNWPGIFSFFATDALFGGRFVSEVCMVHINLMVEDFFVVAEHCTDKHSCLTGRKFLKVLLCRFALPASSHSPQIWCQAHWWFLIGHMQESMLVCLSALVMWWGLSACPECISPEQPG